MAMTKVKNLQLWCKKMADGYRDVEVKDMAASWKSGLAFCAIIHRFRPDLIDYDSLSKENVFDNNNLAFEVAEKQLNIPAFLEAADMVAIRVPDKLSVVTYVSQYYNYFHNKPQLGGPGVNKFNASSKKKDNVVKHDDKSLTPLTANGTPLVKKERQESIGDKCLLCHERVYLLERQIEKGKLYHRSCFRKSEMSPTNKVFKRQPYSPVEEDKNDLHSNKFRKLDGDVSKEPTKPKDTGTDFWQRRAEKKAEQAAKVEQMDSDTKIDKKSESKTVVAGNTDVPNWKKDLEKSKLDETPKRDMLYSRLGNDKDRKVSSNVSSGLANKFKELNERNLKVLSTNDTGSSDSNNKIKVTANERPPKFGIEIKDTDSNVKSRLSPVPKPRNYVQSKPEQMEVETSGSHKTRPVSRFNKSEETPVPKATPRNINKEPKSPVESRKKDFNRPKTPPQAKKSMFNLNLTKNGKETNVRNSLESPPPLPQSTPPKLPSSGPQKHTSTNVPKFSLDTSPKSSPRNPKSSELNDASNHASNTFVAPQKPPRTSALIETNSKPVPSDTSSKFKQKSRCDSPMDTTEMHVAPKAVIKGPNTEQSAVLVVPKRPQDEKKNRQVFGGLLKSLADVRSKHDVVTEEKSDTDVKDKYNNKEMNGAKKEIERTEIKHKFDKVTDSSKSDWKSKGAKPQRPKSSFVSQSSNIFDNEKNDHNAKVGVTKVTKTTTTTTVVTTNKNGKKTKDVDKKVEKTVIKDTDGDIPQWKRDLELRKKDKARPKSADLLKEKSESGKDIPLWQIEAEKRKEARKGGYVDPEKTKLNTNINSSNQQSGDIKSSRPLSPPRRMLDESDKFTSDVKVNVNKSKSPERPNTEIKIGKPGDNVKENQKKKITVAGKFNFDDIELKPANKRKPPRPAVSPLQSPTSVTPKSVPLRPPPPKTGTPQSPSHHLSATQIQKQLKLIDERLTKLELNGRALEDSIRKAREEDEDDLMINWFELVNEKNELVRKECDIIYISREQELEMEQLRIDQRLRELVDKPDKTEEDEKEEEMLMEELVDVVNQRSNIVDSIDEDRIRYMEEDSNIAAILQEKAFSLHHHKKHKKKRMKGLGFLKDSKDGGIKKDKTKK